MFSVRASLRCTGVSGDHSAGGARCNSPGLAGMGGKSSPARAQEARANAKADRRSGGPAGAPCRAHQEGLPKVWAEICSQPNHSAISGSSFGTKYWKCAESDDGNPKKSMILHRMVPSASPLHLSGPAFSRLMVIMFLCAWRLPSFGPQPCASRGSTNQNGAGKGY